MTILNTNINNFFYMALQALFIVYKKTFETKTDIKHCRLFFKTTNIEEIFECTMCKRTSKKQAETSLLVSAGFLYCL